MAKSTRQTTWAQTLDLLLSKLPHAAGYLGGGRLNLGWIWNAIRVVRFLLIRG